MNAYLLAILLALTGCASPVLVYDRDNPDRDIGTFEGPTEAPTKVRDRAITPSRPC